MHPRAELKGLGSEILIEKKSGEINESQFQPHDQHESWKKFNDPIRCIFLSVANSWVTWIQWWDIF
jgi:hypothetical protein